jgi:hypothetical protein
VADLALNLNRTRRELLDAISRGRVHRTFKGTIIRQMGGSFNRRCETGVREFEAAGWVRLGDDQSTYELTEDGRAALDGDGHG